MPLIENDKFAISRGGKLFSVESRALKAAYSSDPVVKVSLNPPPTPVEGTLWWSPRQGNLFVWYDDGDSQQWVDASPAFVEVDYTRLESFLDQSVLDNSVSEIKPGSGILISPLSGKGTVTVSADTSYVDAIESSILSAQQTQDARILELESAVTDLADRLTGIENILNAVEVIDGGYPNAGAIFTQPDTDGGAQNAGAVFTDSIDAGSAAS